MAREGQDATEQVREYSLLGLPRDLRHRIYLHTGVARFDGIPYAYYLDDTKDPDRFTHPSEFDPPPTRDFLGLMRSCRTLYVETAALLYSANRFTIFYSHRGLFNQLRALSSTSLASLTSLKIVLNQSCGEHDPDRFPRYCWCDGHAADAWAANHHCTNYRTRGGRRRGDPHRSPLLSSVLDSDLNALASAEHDVQAMMSDWDDAVAHISPHIGIGRLELFFVCDINPEHPYASEAARLSLAPIVRSPRLKDCYVRLSKTPHHPFQQMAQEIALQACGKTAAARLRHVNPSNPSAFTNIPPELRIRILEYSDLVTPWREITWSRQDRGYVLVHSICGSSRRLCPPQNHHGCRLFSCDPHNVVFRGPYVPSSGCCFCRRRHSAFSFSCNCWAPPTDLFLICRTLYRDAQYVFFSGNRFIIHDFQAWRPWTLPHVQLETSASTPGIADTDTVSATRYYPFERFAISEFLRTIVPANCLPCLRFLELVFPPYIPHGWPRDDHPAIKDWIATVDWMREPGRLNIAALTLRVVMAEFGSGPCRARRGIPKESAGHIIHAYMRITEPLRPLVQGNGNGSEVRRETLAGFYIQVAHPARWMSEVLRRAENDEKLVERMQRYINRQAEQYVRRPMKAWGHVEEDDVDDEKRRKTEPSMSTWQRWYDVDPYGD